MQTDTSMKPTRTPAPVVRKILASLAVSPLLLVQATLPAVASSSDDNRFLDMDLVQLMQVTVTSVA